MRRRPLPPSRRRLLGALAAAWLAPEVRAAGATPPTEAVVPRPLRFPADHAAHPGTRIEWWYLTGWLATAAEDAAASAPRPDFGFQVTFFRSRTGLAGDSPSRFAARQIVFAHVALTDLGRDGRHPARLVHDQRTARAAFALARTPDASEARPAVSILDWSLERPPAPAPMSVRVRAEAFALQLDLRATQPLLLQGDAGFSRKGPLPSQASHYYSEPQLALDGRLGRPGAAERPVRGRAWLDHEWSNEVLAPDAVGWDWIGFNLFDGSALTAFQLRRADGRALWAGGSWRAASGANPAAAGRARAFAPEEVQFIPGRLWTSAATAGRYPVEWQVNTPAGRFAVRALLDAQELDGRGSTGSVYWEGLSELLDARGARVGLGYLEMTGRAGRLQL